MEWLAILFLRAGRHDAAYCVQCGAHLAIDNSRAQRACSALSLHLCLAVPKAQEAASPRSGVVNAHDVAGRRAAAQRAERLPAARARKHLQRAKQAQHTVPARRQDGHLLRRVQAHHALLPRLLRVRATAGAAGARAAAAPFSSLRAFCGARRAGGAGTARGGAGRWVGRWEGYPARGRAAGGSRCHRAIPMAAAGCRTCSGAAGRVLPRSSAAAWQNSWCAPGSGERAARPGALQVPAAATMLVSDCRRRAAALAAAALAAAAAATLAGAACSDPWAGAAAGGAIDREWAGRGGGGWPRGSQQRGGLPVGCPEPDKREEERSSTCQAGQKAAVVSNSQSMKQIGLALC